LRQPIEDRLEFLEEPGVERVHGWVVQRDPRDLSVDLIPEHREIHFSLPLPPGATMAAIVQEVGP